MPDLRDRKKMETRQRLMYAALELFAEHGYADVTVEQIAARADVGARTFFRYFDSKPAACFGYGQDGHAELAETDDPIETSRAQILGYAALVRADPALYETQIRLTLDHPQVRLKRVENQLAFEQAIAEALTRIRPGLSIVRARLAGSLFAHIARTVMELWVLDGAPRPGPDFEPALELACDTAYFVLNGTAPGCDNRP